MTKWFWLEFFRFFTHSSRGSSEASGGGGPQLHSTKGDVALPDARQAARSDPWLPGSLCARGKRRVTGPAPHQGRHAGRRPGMTISQFPVRYHKHFKIPPQSISAVFAHIKLQIFPDLPLIFNRDTNRLCQLSRLKQQSHTDATIKPQRTFQRSFAQLLFFFHRPQIVYLNLTVVVLQILLEYGKRYGCSPLLGFITYCCNILFPSAHNKNCNQSFTHLGLPLLPPWLLLGTSRPRLYGNICHEMSDCVLVSNSKTQRKCWL